MYWITEEMVAVMVRERVPAAGAPRFVAPPRRRSESQTGRLLRAATLAVREWLAQTVRGTKPAQPRLTVG